MNYFKNLKYFKNINSIKNIKKEIASKMDSYPYLLPKSYAQQQQQSIRSNLNEWFRGKLFSCNIQVSFYLF